MIILISKHRIVCWGPSRGTNQSRALSILTQLVVPGHTARQELDESLVAFACRFRGASNRTLKQDHFHMAESCVGGCRRDQLVLPPQTRVRFLAVRSSCREVAQKIANSAIFFAKLFLHCKFCNFFCCGAGTPFSSACRFKFYVTLNIKLYEISIPVT